MEVPKHIVDTINTLLAPYGREYTPEGTRQDGPGKGYLSGDNAAKYLGVTRMTLWRWVRDGRIPRPAKTTEHGSRGGKLLFAVSDLDRFVESLK